MSDSGRYRQPTEAEAGDVDIAGSVKLENTSGADVDPATEGTVSAIQAATKALEDALVSVAVDRLRVRPESFGPFSARTTQTATTVAVSPGARGGPVTVVVDANGSGTLTVGVSTDGGTTVDEFTESYTTDGTTVEVAGFGYVEVSADSNLNGLVLSSKGP